MRKTIQVIKNKRKEDEIYIWKQKRVKQKNSVADDKSAKWHAYN